MVETSKSAITALVLGIVSVFTISLFGLGMLLGILAIIFGIVSLRKIKKENLSGRGMAIAGILIPLIWILLIAFLAFFGILNPAT